MSALRVDAHLHFWHYSAEEYPWIDERMAGLRRDFLPQDAALELARAGVHGVVAVQARQTVAETAWLLRLAAESSFIWGVVGWVDLRGRGVSEELDAAAGIVGVRHVLQDEPSGFLELPALNRGIAELTARGLTYDLLVRRDQLREATFFVDRHPEQRFVLDHLAKPGIATRELEPWRTELAELARRPNVWAKVSGLVTEADWARWTLADLRPYLDAAWQAFGPDRLLFGSDHPVCRLAADYQRVLGALSAFLSQASDGERARVLGSNALSVYRLSAR